MQRKIIGKNINEFAQSRNDLPDYFGIRYLGACDDWDKPYRKVNGEFIARKYNAILEIIQETKAQVEIKPNIIHILYQTGEIKIDRDLLTDTFLLPLIN
jgi:hypothetical protein